MKIMITGANGQLGKTLAIASSNYQLIAYSHQQLDITNAQQLTQKITQDKPQILINCAAYTAVDKAEDEVDLAQQINAQAVKQLATLCQQHQIILFHISTDYVFSGQQHQTYNENQPSNPLSVYGKSKLAGEQAIQNCCDKYIILRTSWVFALQGHNFVNTMLKLFTSQQQLSIVDDQWGCPTATEHLQAVIWAMIEKIRQPEFTAWGIYHYCDQPSTTWYGFAQAIYKEACKQQASLSCELTSITTAEYPTRATRPMYSVLNCDKIAQLLAIQPYDWRPALAAIVEQYDANLSSS